MGVIIVIVIIICLAVSGGGWRISLYSKRARNFTHRRRGYCRDCRHLTYNTTNRGYIKSDYYCSIRITSQGNSPDDICDCCEPPD